MLFYNGQYCFLLFVHFKNSKRDVFFITDEEDSPVIRGFSDDEPLVIA